MTTEGSLPHSQVPTICPSPEPDQSSPCPRTHFLKTHLNIILPSTPRSSNWSLSLRFPHQKPVYTSIHPIRVTGIAYLIPLDCIIRTIFGEEYRSLSSSLCTFLHSPDTSSLLDSNIFLSTLFSYTLSLRSSLNISDQVHTHTKQQEKI